MIGNRPEKSGGEDSLFTCENNSIIKSEALFFNHGCEVTKKARKLFKDNEYYRNIGSYSFTEGDADSYSELPVYKCVLDYVENKLPYYKTRLFLLENLIKVIGGAKSKVLFIAGECRQFLVDNSDADDCIFDDVNERVRREYGKQIQEKTTPAKSAYEYLNSIIDEKIAELEAKLSKGEELKDYDLTKEESKYFEYLVKLKTSQLCEAVLDKIDEMPSIEITMIMGPTLRTKDSDEPYNSIVQALAYSGYLEKDNINVWVSKFHNGTHLTYIDDNLLHIESAHLRPKEYRECWHIDKAKQDSSGREKTSDVLGLFEYVMEDYIGLFSEQIKILKNGGRSDYLYRAVGTISFYYATAKQCDAVFAFLTSLTEVLNDDNKTKYCVEYDYCKINKAKYLDKEYSEEFHKGEIVYDSDTDCPEQIISYNYALEKYFISLLEVGDLEQFKCLVADEFCVDRDVSNKLCNSLFTAYNGG